MARIRRTRRPGEPRITKWSKAVKEICGGCGRIAPLVSMRVVDGGRVLCAECYELRPRKRLRKREASIGDA